jgi:hypothetical protein
MIRTFVAFLRRLVSSKCSTPQDRLGCFYWEIFTHSSNKKALASASNNKWDEQSCIRDLRMELGIHWKTGKLTSDSVVKIHYPDGRVRMSRLLPTFTINLT